MYKSLENFLLNFLQILHPSLVEQLSNILYLRNKNVINNNFTCKKKWKIFSAFFKIQDWIRNFRTIRIFLRTNFEGKEII